MQYHPTHRSDSIGSAVPDTFATGERCDSGLAYLGDPLVARTRIINDGFALVKGSALRIGSALTELGYICEYRGQPGFATRSRFLTELSSGANLIPPREFQLSSLRAIHYEPLALVEEIVGQTREAIGSAHGRPLYQFNMVNFDSYVHRYGYDERLARALNVLRQHIGSLQRDFPGLCIRGKSDHGMIEQATWTCPFSLIDNVQ